VAGATVFGAGAAGTAIAIHLARTGSQVTLWGSRFDTRVLEAIEAERRHPALSEPIPETVRVLGPDDLKQAAADVDVAVMGANSAGARSLATMVVPALDDVPIVVSLAKGLEPGTGLRTSEVYTETFPDSPVVALSGPSLAPEVAEGLLTAVAMASDDADALATVAERFRAPSFLVDTTDDVVGVEVCGVAKNVAAIAAGVLEGSGQQREQTMKNALSALFTRAAHEIAALAEALGGRRETAYGLAGIGDLLVTSLGGRNRLYGEAIGLGADPASTLADMTERGLTVEGADSARDVYELTRRTGVTMPIHEAVHRVVHEGAPTTTILEAIR